MNARYTGLLWLFAMACAAPLASAPEETTQAPSPGHRLVLESSGSDEGDARVIEARFRALGRTVDVSSSPRHIEVMSRRPFDEAQIASVLTPNRLSMRTVVDLAGAVDQRFAGFDRFETLGSGTAPRVQTAVVECDGADAWRSAESTPECVRAVGAVEPLSEGPQCQLYCLESSQVIGTGDVASAAAQPGQFGDWRVAVELNADARARFAAYTEGHLGYALAITVDHRVFSAPHIASPITGGRLEITLGYGATEVDAQTLAAALSSGALQADWTVVSVE
ncbi:MAG: hypothetical protein AAF411_03085 [Myxococcota bacterium]